VRPVLGWFTRCAISDRERWSLWIPVAVGLGVASYFSIPAEPPLWLGWAAALGAIMIGVVGRARLGVVIVAFGLAGAGIGFGAAGVRTALVAAPILSRENGPGDVQGLVVSVEPVAGGQRLVLENPTVEGIEPEATPWRLRIRFSGTQPAFAPGDRVKAFATVGPPSPPSIPGAYDFQRHAFFEGIGGVGFALGPAELEVPPAGSIEAGGIRLGIETLRQRMTQRILGQIPAPAGAVAAALITGSQSAIQRQTMSEMRDSGLAHLLSISGLHMGFVAAILFGGLRAVLALVPAIALTRPIKKWAAAAAILGTAFYLVLSGASVPAERSFLMAGLVLLAVLVDRSAISMRLIAWAALVVLLLSPEALIGPSFQMSFGAVVALIAAFEAWRDRRARWRSDHGWLGRAGLTLVSLAATSLIATLATAPPSIYHFNRLADYGVVANMLAVPLSGFWIMPWAVAACVLMPLGLDWVALAPMGWGIEVLLAIAREVAGWPGSVALVPAMPVAALGFIAFGGLWLCLWRANWRYLGVVPIVLGFLAMPWVTPPDILVSDDGKLMAVRDEAGRLLLSSGRASRFDADIWLRQSGQDEKAVWPVSGATADGSLACDILGCIYRHAGRTVALVKMAEALDEDCAVADAVVSIEPVRRGCGGPQVVIDRLDLWRQGGHALWITPTEIRVLSVAATRGSRPWVVRPESRRTAISSGAADRPDVPAP